MVIALQAGVFLAGEGMIDPINYLIFSSVLLMIGAYGVIKNKNAIVVLMSVEIMLTAANINFIGFSSYYHDLSGQVVLYLLRQLRQQRLQLA